MFRNLFSKSTQPGKKQADVIYKEYRSFLRDKLLPLGFDVREGSGLGNFSVFKRGDLEISLEFELREGETYVQAKSGSKVKFKSVLDKLPENIRKKVVNLHEAEEQLVDNPDISLTLEGTDEEKEGFTKNLEEWLIEHV